MEDKLLRYYEQELTFIREMGAEFARKYPKIAGRLMLEPGKCEDPHTERLIEAFSFISGRIHKKIDDDFPEITQALLSIVYPHYVNPIPSMSIVRFDPNKQNIPPVGYELKKNTALFSKPVNHIPCQFTTSQPVKIWPVEVVGAGLREPDISIKGARQTIYIKLKTLNRVKASAIAWDHLRFYLNGPGQHIYPLYELLFNNAVHVEVSGLVKSGNMMNLVLRPDDIKQVGFGPEDGILPYSERSFPGYTLLFEYFCFPEKFLFFDLHGLDKLRKFDLADEFEIRINIDKSVGPNLAIGKDTFCLNATPVVNLFKRIAEPVRVEQEKTEYRVVPDARRQAATEVYSIDKVSASSQMASGEDIEFKPFYSIRHHLVSEEGQTGNVFWQIQRRDSNKKGDDGTDVFLSFTTPDFKPSDPGVDILTVRTTCTNRNLASRLSFGDKSGDFDLETAAPVARITSLIQPTPERTMLGGELQWRLISHLSLNYMSIVQGGENALKEILKLYDFDNSPATNQQINGIVSINSRYVTRRMGKSFCRGVEVTIQFDEEKYVGAGLFLFASVLERFLGMYVSVNSFSQLKAATIQRQEVLKLWPPRNGNQVLL